MKVIGITGGVGCGKSKVMEYVSSHYNCEVIYADTVAYDLEQPGQACYKPIVDLFGKSIVNEDGNLNRNEMARQMFSNNSLLEAVNSIVHPAVWDFIVNRIEELKKTGVTKYLFLEAALLIECGYKAIVDEMWYVYVDESIRRERLKKSRGYSDEKIDQILASQLSDDEFRANVDKILDNSNEIQKTYDQIDKFLSEDFDHE